MSAEREHQIAELRQGDHVCQIYRDAAEQRATVVAFVKEGLSRGERCLSISDEQTAAQLAPALAAAGVDVSGAVQRGALSLLTPRDTSLRSGTFVPALMLDLLRQAMDEALAAGFSGLRATGEMSWAVGAAEGCERLIEYEALLNTFIPHQPLTGLCQYPRRHLDAAATRDLLRTHPLVILGDQVCSNFYYEPPEIVLGQGDPREHVEWMIGQLQRARTTEQSLRSMSGRLVEQTASLEHEIAQRRQAEEALAVTSRRKDEILATLAHELRNPLGAISNATQLLKRFGPAEPRLQRARETIERQVNHQIRLIDDLLDISRITRGKISLEREWLDLAWVIRHTAEDHRGALEAAGLTLRLELPDEPVWYAGDRTRLAQVLGNLLINAIKFTNPGGEVGVKLGVGSWELGVGDPIGLCRPQLPTPSSQLPASAVLTVRDTGIGIDAEMLPRVFESFAQADRSLDRTRGGLGLGLALVKGLIELHGGTVRAASAGLGHGSTFTLTLPLPPVEAPAPAEIGVPPTPAGCRRILVVDDNRAMAETLRDVLELSGHEVSLAFSGPEGVLTARTLHPDVMLCDIGLPGMNGYEVAQAVRQDPDIAATHLIAVSGYGQEEDRQRSHEAGFEEHLVKPVNLTELDELLATEPAGT